MRKLVHLLLVVTLVFSLLPASSVLAEAPAAPQDQQEDSNTPADANQGTVEQSSGNDPLNLQVRAAVLMEVETGQVLYASNGDVSLPPASVTKVMTMLIIMEAIEKGHASWDDIVIASEKAHKMTGSRVFLANGEKATLRDMLQAVAVYSANDCAVALAEHIAGSEEGFVNLMNDKARELGLRNTRFLNVTGLPYIEQYPNFNEPDGHTMSAMDIAIISRELVKNHPGILEFTSTKFATFQNGVDMPTRNNLLLRHDWIDGLKTGFTDEAMNCLSATGEKDGMRLISVILGAETDRIRQDETVRLFNYGFEKFAKRTMVRGKDLVTVAKIDKGKERELTLLAAENLDIVVEKGLEEEYKQVIEVQESIIAPIEANAVLGKVFYERDGVMVGKAVNLVAQDDVEKGGFFRLLFRGIKDTFFGIFEGIADKIVSIFTKEGTDK